MKQAFALAFGLALTVSASAQAPVYKCVDNGKVSYTNVPCADGKKVDTRTSRGVVYEGRKSSKSR